MINAKPLLIRALELRGEDSQFDMAQEECAELIFTICKRRRNRATFIQLIEECVDVELIIEQMKLIFTDSEQTWQMIRDTKLLELEEKLNLEQFLKS